MECNRCWNGRGICYEDCNLSIRASVSESYWRESARQLAEISLGDLLANLRLPADTDIDDIDDNPNNDLMDSGFLSGDSDFEYSDTEEGPSAPKQPKLGNTHSYPSRSNNTGICKLFTPASSKTEMVGEWESDSIRPVPSMIFGQNLKYIDILTPLGHHMDGSEPYLPKLFVFALNSKGHKKFKLGRRAFLSEVGEIVRFT